MPRSLAPLPYPNFTAPQSLQSDEVHLWLLNMGNFSTAHHAEALRIMSADEAARGEKFLRGKAEYIASRWLLRQVLARYTGTSAETVGFVRTDKGKPYLSDSDIQFSLSHSGHWVVLAVGQNELLGVDIEEGAAKRDLFGIAESYYHPQEFARLQVLDELAQSDYFYRLWTLKEAFVKAIGTGISVGLEKIHFVLDPHKISAIIDPTLKGDMDIWHFHQWTMIDSSYCALAYANAQTCTIKWFDALAAPAFP